MESGSKTFKTKMTKCQGMYNSTSSECHKLGCNFVKAKNGGTYCRSPAKRKPLAKSPKRMTKCQGMYNSTSSECHKLGCNFVKTKSGGTYCRSPVKKMIRSPTKKPSVAKSNSKKRSKCQGMKGSSMEQCNSVGCNVVRPKSAPTYCRSPAKKIEKSPKRFYAKKTRRSPSKSPKRFYAKKTRRSPSKKIMNIVELD